jgi:hypothetical protein
MKNFSKSDNVVLFRSLEDRYTNLVDRAYELKHLETISVGEMLELRDILDELSKVAFLVNELDPQR